MRDRYKTRGCLILLTFSTSLMAKNNEIAEHFINEVKKSADTEKPLNERISVKCPTPSGYGLLRITKASYDFNKSLGAYVFSDGEYRNVKLSWIALKFKDDDFSSEMVTGIDFGFSIPNGQFFVTVMKTGKKTVGVSSNKKVGLKKLPVTY